MITAVVDSGAEETVVPPGLFPGQVEESPMQRAGGRYRAANGSRLPNLGQQVASLKTSEGLNRALRFQLAGVERPLISVAQLARAGHRVEIGAVEGDNLHVPSGQKLRLQRAGGVYLLRMMVREPGTSNSAGNGSSPLGDAPSARLPQSISTMEGAVRSSPVFSRPRA